MAQERKFRTGTDLIKQSAESKGKRKFTPNIYWKAGDIKTIAWLTAAEDIPKVRLHKMVRIPDDSKESGFRWETLLCRKDPSMAEEFGGSCPLCDVVGHEAQEQFVALAIELDQIKSGKTVSGLEVVVDEVKRDDGTTVEYPHWGIVIQASKNFFSYFAAYSESQDTDIREVAWEIQREGGGTDTKYHPYVVMAGKSAVDLPDLSVYDDNIPSLYDLLEEMGSDEKYDAVSGLEPGSQPTFGGSKRSDDSGTVIPVGDEKSEFEKIKESLTSY